MHRARASVYMYGIQGLMGHGVSSDVVARILV